jgi:hydroxymethylglutaryl-CoA reductase (NADPH)
MSKTLIPKYSGTSAFRSISTIFGKGIHRAAKLSSRNPIEMIAGILILSSFSYFYLFNLARSTSDIFSGTVTRLYPTFVYADKDATHFQQLTRNELSSLEQDATNTVKIQLKQVLITDQVKNNNVIDRNTLNSILRFQNTIQHTLLDDHVGQFGYNSLCFKDASGECFSQSLSTLFDNELDTNEDLHKIINQYPELAQSIFGELDLNASTASSILLSFAFNASTVYRQELSHLWEQKVATISSTNGDLVSLSNTTGNQEDIFTWIFIITRNIIFRIKELIEVCVT